MDCWMTMAVLAASLATSLARAETFYFSAEHGDDANTGLAPAEAWRSLSKIQAAGDLVGATVLLETGSVWVDESLVLDGLVNGSLSSFGSVVRPRPAILTSRSAVLDPTAKLAAKSRCITLYGPFGVTIERVHLAGCFKGIQIRYPVAPLTAVGGIVVRNCSFADIRAPYGAYEPAATPWGSAIEVVHSPGLVLRNLTIRNNVATRLDVFVKGAPGVDGLFLEGNTVARCGGNCIDLGDQATNMHLVSSVFLRDTPEMLFLYGTTDVIIGTVIGNNSITDSDFNTRGEAQPGPDGCAVDFETSASGFLLKGNTFYRSWGAGVMVFGHSSTSHGLMFIENNFIYAGCVQALGDHASISLMCPNGNVPSGTIAHNNFISCPGVEAIHTNPQVPGCGSNVTMIGNTMTGLTAVDQPQISYLPPSPDNTDPFPLIPVVAHCSTPNATLRYTTDGSRPEATDPIFPMPRGLAFRWPGPNVAVNVRGFLDGSLPSITNGIVVERRRYTPRVSVLRSSLDGVAYSAAAGTVTAIGWVVNPTLAGGGLPPVSIRVVAQIGDAAPVIVTALADKPRPDLVKAKVAPNPDHGFSVSIPYVPPPGNAPSRAAWSSFPKPTITVNVLGIVPPNAADLANSPMCLCGSAACSCID